MKPLAAIFAVIALSAAILAFGVDVLLLYAHVGKMAFVLALLGFFLTASAYLVDELLPDLDFGNIEMPT